MPNLPSATKNIISQVEIPHENDLLEKLLGMDSPPLPTPKQPSKCPLFCCFYAEFDIKVGPVIKFQSPKDFMNNDISISTEKIHGILSKTFENCSVAENSTTAEAATAKLETADLSSKEPTKNEKAGGKSNLLSEAGGLSIFDSTSEYIITGSELTGKIISLSTHDIHIISRPTLISDARYERNALLFSVGMVLRRAADPRPFRTIVTKLALTLRSMEIESQFLSKPSLRKQVQPLLERILLSLNNPQWECNLLLSPSNALNLKLFHPPKPETYVA